jgi:hypothetical protein
MRELTNIERENVQGGSIDAGENATITYRAPSGEWITIIVGPILLGF